MSLSESLSGDLPEYVGPRQSPPQPQSRFAPPPDMIGQLTQALEGLFFVQQSEQINTGRIPMIVLRGKLLGDAEALYPTIAERFKTLGYTPTMERRGEFDVIIAVEGLLVARRFSTPGWVHGLLLLATILTTMLSGAHFYSQAYTLDRVWARLVRGDTVYLLGALKAGAPFAITLLLILGIHEMGHYIAARRHGVDVTLPYFIPLPFLNILGTLGAVIFIKSPLTNRKALFDVGISGPLAGFIVGIIAFVISLRLPTIDPLQNLAFYEIFPGFRGLGIPLLLQWTTHLFAPGTINLSRFILQQPVALAAWFGMLLTVLNLLPIGQLDGGHVMYTLFGRFAWTIAMLAFFALIFLGLTVFQPLLFYAVLVFLTGLRHPPPGNDITPLDLQRKVLGYGTIVLFFLIATATPFIFRLA